MEVTKVFFKEITKGNKLLAYATVEFDGTMLVSGFKVFQGASDVFVTVPQEKREETYYDTVKWSDKQFYQKGADPHPVLTAVKEHWHKHAGTGKQTSSSRASSAKKSAQEKQDLPW